MVVAADVPIRDAVAWDGGFVAVHDAAYDPALNLHTVTYFPTSENGDDPRPLSEGGSVQQDVVSNLDTTSGLTIGGEFWFGGGLSRNSVIQYRDEQWTGWGLANNAYIGMVGSVCHIGNFMVASASIPSGCITESGVYQWYDNTWSFIMEPELEQLKVMWESLIYGFNGASVYRLPGAEPVGTAIGGGISALSIWNNELIAGGDFESVGGATQGVLAAHSGSSWYSTSPTSGVGQVRHRPPVVTDVAAILDLPDQTGEQVAISNGETWQVLPGTLTRRIASTATCWWSGPAVLQVGDLSAARLVAWRDAASASTWRGLARRLVYVFATLDDYYLAVKPRVLAARRRAAQPGGDPEPSWMSRETPTCENREDFRIPTPAIRAVTIAYELPQATDVVIDVFDLGGRRMDRLANGWQEAGRRSVVWRGTDASGRPVASGVYQVLLVDVDAAVDLTVVPVRVVGRSMGNDDRLLYSFLERLEQAQEARRTTQKLVGSGVEQRRGCTQDPHLPASTTELALRPGLRTPE